MKLTVCAGCRQVMMTQDAQGKPFCLICYGELGNSIPVEINLPEKLTCSCGSIAVLNAETGLYHIELSPKGGWNSIKGHSGDVSIGEIPFVDCEHNTFYCGHDGWS